MRGSQTVDWSRAYGLMQRKSNRRIIASTAYTAAFARLLDPLCDLLLVDCDVAVLMHGLPERGGADLDMMLMHGRSVSRGAKRSAVVIELPASAWMQSPEQAFRSASRLLDETECCGVMLPLETVAIETTRFLLDRGIPVMSGVDIAPPADAGLGRQFAEGEKEWLRIQVLKDAAAVGQAGVFAIVATGRNDALALQLSKAVAVPVIGAESASLCDGDLLRDVECLALINSARRNADLNARAVPRAGSSPARGPGRAARPADRSAVQPGTAGPRGNPRPAAADPVVAAAPSPAGTLRAGPTPRVDAVSRPVGDPERALRSIPPARPERDVARRTAAPIDPGSHVEPLDDTPRPAARLAADARADRPRAGGLAAGATARTSLGRAADRVVPPGATPTSEPAREIAAVASRQASPPVVSPAPPSSAAPAPLSDSLQHSLEALFGLDPASGEPPPRRLRPVDPARDPEAALDAVEPRDPAGVVTREPPVVAQRDAPAPAAAVTPMPPRMVDRPPSRAPAIEPVSGNADASADRRRAAARRPVCRPAPVRRRPAREPAAAVTEAPGSAAVPATPPPQPVRPRLVPPPTAATPPVVPSGAKGEADPAVAAPDERFAIRGDGLRRFAVRAAGVVLLIGAMIASGFGAAAYLKSPAGEASSDAAPARTRSGGKGEFGAVQGLAAHAPPRDAFAPRDRPVEVKILQTRPLF